MILDLTHLVLDTVERFLVRHVADNDGSMSAPAVSAGDCLETLLTRSVPNLWLDGCGLMLRRAILEFYLDAQVRMVTVHGHRWLCTMLMFSPEEHTSYGNYSGNCLLDNH